MILLQSVHISRYPQIFEVAHHDSATPRLGGRRWIWRAS